MQIEMKLDWSIWTEPKKSSKKWCMSACLTRWNSSLFNEKQEEHEPTMKRITKEAPKIMDFLLINANRAIKYLLKTGVTAAESKFSSVVKLLSFNRK